MFVKHQNHSQPIITPEKPPRTIHSFSFDPKSRKSVKIGTEIEKKICAVFEFMLILPKIHNSEYEIYGNA